MLHHSARSASVRRLLHRSPAWYWPSSLSVSHTWRIAQCKIDLQQRGLLVSPSTEIKPCVAYASIYREVVICEGAGRLTGWQNTRSHNFGSSQPATQPNESARISAARLPRRGRSSGNWRRGAAARAEARWVIPVLPLLLLLSRLCSCARGTARFIMYTPLNELLLSAAPPPAQLRCSCCPAGARQLAGRWPVVALPAACRGEERPPVPRRLPDAL